MNTAPPPIPNHLLFVWYGKRLPFSCELALRSAIHHCRPDRVYFFFEGLESEIPRLQKDYKAECIPCSEVRRHWFKDLPTDVEMLGGLYDALSSHASRSNLVRLAALWKVGGVYLDTDTLTIRDLAPLRRYRGFCGLEPLALPSDLFESLNPLRWGTAGFRLGLREICARLPGGYRLFRPFEKVFFFCVNNAVMGSTVKNPKLEEAFRSICEMPPKMQLKRYRLGTHLLQKITENRSRPGMEVLPPDVFYPLGPEISAHWFKRQPSRLDTRLITKNTRVIHWYHSVEKRFLREEISPVLLNNNPQWPFSRLATPWLHGQSPSA